MHILKPPWIHHADDQTHQRKTIYSISVHPHGSKLATGSIDRTIKVWDTSSIYQPPPVQKGKGIQPLATLAAHAGPVMCVRFDSRGRLASGSDDSAVIVWEQRTKSNPNDPLSETWVALKTLGGHVRDVTGVAWSEDGGLLASCGIDGQVFVYHGDSFETIALLNGHSSMVKGLCWDPVGEFLATQSSDRSIKIWNTSDWSEATSITSPFVDAPYANFFTRLSWSPCGTYIVAPNATNNGVFVSSVITRGKSGEEWDASISLVGHEDIVDVALFNPLIFLKDPKGPTMEGQNFTSVLALGSATEVSLWITKNIHGVGIFRDVFDGEVLDLAWSPDGYTLLATSSDGWIAIFHFERDELPPAAPTGTKEQYLSEYGFDPSTRNGTLMQTNIDPLPFSKPVSTATIEAKPAKRRVQLSNPALPQANGTGPNAAKEVTTNLSAGDDGMSGLAQSTIASKSNNSLSFPFSVNGNGNMAPLPFIPPPQIQQHQYVPNAVPGYSFAQPTPLSPTPKIQEGANGGGLRNGKRPAELMEEDDPMDGGSYGKNSRGGRRERDGLYDDPDMSRHIPPSSERGRGRLLGGDKQREPPPPKGELKPAYLPVTEDEAFAHLHDGAGVSRRGGREALAVPAIKTHSAIKHDAASGESDVFDVRNFSDEKRSEVSLVNSAGRLYFIDYLPSYVVCSTSNPVFSAVSCEDSTIHVYSPAGRRLVPSLVLDSPAAFMDCSSYNLMVLTARGNAHSWDVRNSKAIHPPISIRPLLLSSRTPNCPNPTILTAKIRRNGYPILILSSGMVYTFDASLQSWVTLTGLWWSRGSEFWEGRSRGAKANSVLTSKTGVLKSLEQEVNEILIDSEAGTALRGPRVGEEFTPPPQPEGEVVGTAGSRDDFRNALSLGHLESRMSAAVMLDSPQEFKVALLAYAKRIGEEGFRNKADELIKELMGPVFFKPSREQNWTATILDFNKRDLLKEVLGIFNKSRLLNKLGSENLDLLKKITQEV
ncbi:WD40 repeat-like protein [Atractiella rhizophila]|nr:WD40 repeat-like protein [Atractiella rhizophila]